MRGILTMEVPNTLTRSRDQASRRDNADRVKFVGRTQHLCHSILNCWPHALAVVVAFCTVAILSTVFYKAGRSIDSELRFFEPSRAPSIDEAVVACPIGYAPVSYTHLTLPTIYSV